MADTHECTEEWGVDRAQLGHGSHCRWRRQGKRRLIDLEIARSRLSTVKTTNKPSSVADGDVQVKSWLTNLEFKRVFVWLSQLPPFAFT